MTLKASDAAAAAAASMPSHQCQGCSSSNNSCDGPELLCPMLCLHELLMMQQQTDVGSSRDQLGAAGGCAGFRVERLKHI
jgi:hypothetical protein